MSVGDVVAQLKTATEKLDNASIVATRAQVDVHEAHQKLAQVAQGAGHGEINQAVAGASEAAAKMGKFARLAAEAAQDLADYIAAIAPGASPGGSRAVQSAPTGEQILQDTLKRSEARAAVDGFLRKSSRNIEKIQEKGENAAKVVEAAVKEIRHPTGAGGQSTTGTASPTAPAKIEASDAVGNLIVVGVAVGVAAQRTGKAIQQGIARLRKRERRGKS